MATNILAATKRAGLTGDDAVRAMARAMRPVTSYGDVGVEDGETGLSVGRVPGLGHATYVGHAFVAEKPSGGADFTDCRYWLTPIVPVATNNGGGVRAFATGPDPDSTAYVVGTNLDEVAPGSTPTGTDPVKGCHLLSPGTPVAVYLAVDDLGTERYVFSRSPSPVRVRVTDAAGCGKAVYNGKALRDPTADVDKSVDLSASNAGAEGPTVVIRNLSERNRTTTDPWITASWNGDQRDFPGRLSRVNADGTAVVDIAALVAKLCDDAPTP